MVMMKGALLAVVLVGMTGCASIVPSRGDLYQALAPGQLKEGARVHAYQAASFAYAFMDGHEVQWEARLSAAEDDLPPLFEAVGPSGYRLDVDVRERKPEHDGPTYYAVDLVLTKKGERLVLPGEPGTKTADYVRALAPASKRTGIPAEVLRRGHFALYTLATMSGALNASDDALRRHAFGLLVLRDKLRDHEPHADYLAPMRAPAESSADVDLALRVIADHHAESSRLRAEVLAVLALARAYEVPAARAAFLEQIGESKKRAAAWHAAHPRPTTADFGVAVKEWKLPQADDLLAALDKDGYVAAAVKIAKAVATGDPAATVEGFAKLAPPNSSFRVAAEGTAAALRGDVGGATRAVLALAERQSDLAPVVARLRAVEGAVVEARGKVDAVRGKANAIRALTQ